MEPCRKALEDSGLSASEIGAVVLVGGSTRIPLVQAKVKEFFGQDPHKGVNPDEVVAIGAAVQGGVLAGDVKDVLLLDVTPLTLGIETLGGQFTRMIERNTTIPTRKSEVFTTAADNQTSVEIHVLQGERPLSQDNKTLGKFHLVGIPPAPRSVPQIEVTFDIDANGIVNVSAKDKGTGKEQKITITASSGLSKDEIDKMVREAETHADEDKKKQELIEAKNHGETFVYQMEKLLTENKEKIPAADKEAVENGITSLKTAIEGEDMEAINTAMNNLTTASHKISSILYGGENGPADSGPEASAENPADTDADKGDDNVVDAEVVDED